MLHLFVTVWYGQIPVSIDAAGIDVVRPLHSSDWLQAHPCGLKRHDIDEPVLELVAGQVGTDESRGVGFGVGESLWKQCWVQRA